MLDLVACRGMQQRIPCQRQRHPRGVEQSAYPLKDQCGVAFLRRHSDALAETHSHGVGGRGELLGLRATLPDYI